MQFLYVNMLDFKYKNMWHDQQVIFILCQLQMDFFQSLLNLVSYFHILFGKQELLG